MRAGIATQQKYLLNSILNTDTIRTTFSCSSKNTDNYSVSHAQAILVPLLASIMLGAPILLRY